MKKTDQLASVRITTEDVVIAEASELRIATSEQSVSGFALQIDRALIDQLVRQQKNMSIDLPTVRMTFTPQMLGGLSQDLNIFITPNHERATTALQQIARDTDAYLLAAGQGLTIETNVPAQNWPSYVQARVALPDSMRAADITAVVLNNDQGMWTPQPWTLETAGDKTYVRVQLTGQGNLGFLYQAKKFVDVTTDLWAHSAISAAADKLFMMGRAAGQFAPNDTITRAEFPTVLLRVAGMMNQDATTAFTDMNADDWYYRSIAIAVALGIVNGLPDGSYGPNVTLSRVEAMTMVGRLLTALGLSEQLSEEEVDRLLADFADQQLVADWARSAVATTIKYGIIVGTDQHILPQDPLTRAQAASIAIRLDQWLTELSVQ